MTVYLIGIGGGNPELLTLIAAKRIESADLVIGAGRMIEALKHLIKCDVIKETSTPKIAEEILKSDADKICVLFSGDTGFYSGAKKLAGRLEEEKIDFEIIPGISSVQLLSAATGRAWDEWNFFTAHGAEASAVSAVMKGKDAFFVTDSKLSPSRLCEELVQAGLGDTKVYIGENLSYDSQKLYAGTAREASEMEFSPLSVILCEKAPKKPHSLMGIADDEYIRGGVPMTKQEVRAVILSKLDISPADIIWDIGAGTGGVSVEMALMAGDGRVYAVERNEEGIELIKKNRERFSAYNLIAVQGSAPEALEALPKPDKVFIGGSGKNMCEIVRLVSEKNSEAVIVISAIALETLGEAMRALGENGYEIGAVQVQSSYAKKIGEYNMMTANNPIFIITGKKND